MWLKLYKPDDFKAHSLSHTAHVPAFKLTTLRPKIMSYSIRGGCRIIPKTSAVILNKQTSKKLKQLCLKLHKPDYFKAHSLSHTAHVLLAGLQAHNDVDMKKQLI